MLGKRLTARRIVSDLNRSLLLVADPEALEASVATRLKELVNGDRVAILQLDTRQAAFVPRFLEGFPPDAILSFDGRGRLAKWLTTNETALALDTTPDVVAYLEPAERQRLAAAGVRLCAPLIAFNRLTGIVLLGGASRPWRFGAEEADLLRSVTHQASLAFENAGLRRQQQERAQRMYRAESLAAAGTLAAGVAHEIRNPLTSIRSTVQYVLPALAPSDSRRELLEGTLAEIDRIDRIVNGLLSLARPSDSESEPLELSGVVDEALVLVGSQARRQNVRIERELAQRRFTVRGDASQLKQVFLNLLLNALQAMPEGGAVHVSTGVVQPEPARSNAEWVEVRMRDTGPGIPAEQLGRIFDPFFTTKRDGTGLGLSISFGVVERHGGELEILSAPQQGATAIVRLPLV